MNERLRMLFRDLEPIVMTTDGKPDPHENLVDILEIVAVSTGLRAAHLQGQGQFDAHRVSEIEQIVRKHGLNTIRTKPIKPYRHRLPTIDAKIVEWSDADLTNQQLEGPNVLWVFSETQIAGVIPEVVEGRASVGGVLGYPPCCVTEDAEDELKFTESYVQGVIDTYHPATADDLLRLWIANVKVAVGLDPDADIERTDTSLRQFPYGQLIACRACLRNAESPAATINRQMRALAFALSPRFGRDIWLTRDLIINRGRPVAIGRNALCPCGSGSKYKHCCVRIS